MISFSFVRSSLAFLILLAGTMPIWAGNGHILHGAGAVHSGMGGAGAALPASTLGALLDNPALLAATESGHEVELRVEWIEGDETLGGTVTTPFGPFSGTTSDDTGASPIPAFGLQRRGKNSPWAFGFGAIGLAGFTTDYPQDPSNPLLAPQPTGFGQISSDYRYTRMPLVAAYRVNDQFFVGAALTLGWAELSSSPAPFADPDCTGPTTCYYPNAPKEGAFGSGFQVGILWRPTETFSIGASYLSEQQFENLKYNSTVANPNLPTFGTARSFEFEIEMPQTLVLGVAWSPLPGLDVAVDGKWIQFSEAKGFGDIGFTPTGQVLGFGWNDIFVLAAGVEWHPSSRWALRAGINQSESPIDSTNASFSVAAPAVFEDHFSGGVSLNVGGDTRLHLTYYKATSNEVSGPLITPGGAVPGAQVTLGNGLESIVLGLSIGSIGR